jgi:hypothetical protein
VGVWGAGIVCSVALEAAFPLSDEPTDLASISPALEGQKKESERQNSRGGERDEVSEGGGGGCKWGSLGWGR